MHHEGTIREQKRDIIIVCRSISQVLSFSKLSFQQTSILKGSLTNVGGSFCLYIEKGDPMDKKPLKLNKEKFTKKELENLMGVHRDTYVKVHGKIKTKHRG